MKTMLNISLFVMALSGVIALEACGDNDDKPETELEKLPPITQEGKNTFGYLVNGKAMVVRNTMNITAIYQGGVLQLGGG